MKSETKFQLDSTKDKDFPHNPIVKIAHFGNVMSIDVIKVSDFYNGGLWKNSHFLSDPAEISFLTS